MGSSKIVLLVLLVQAVNSQNEPVVVTVPGSLGVDLDADGYVDGFEYVGCRSVTIEQFGIVKAFTFAEAAPISCFELCAASSSEYFGVYGREEDRGTQSVCVCGGEEGFLENIDELEVGTCDFDCALVPDEACGGWRSEGGESADMAIYRLSDDEPVSFEESTGASTDFDRDGKHDRTIRHVGCLQLPLELPLGTPGSRSVTEGASPEECVAMCASLSVSYLGLTSYGEATVCACGATDFGPARQGNDKFNKHDLQKGAETNRAWTSFALLLNCEDASERTDSSDEGF